MRTRSLLLVFPAAAVALCLLALRAPGTNAQASNDNPHGKLDLDCGDCHSPERWVPVDKPPSFHHEKTGFHLESAHARLRCRSCHQSLLFNQVGTACADCHKDAHRGELGFRCEQCHTPRSWTNQAEIFRVHGRTRFPLLAVHASLDCEACHRGQRPSEYSTTPAECGTCHAATYDLTTRPNHAQVSFSRRCEECHRVTARTWQDIDITGFQHPASFPLVGAHGGIRCSTCHASGFGNTSTQCFSCHERDYRRAANPNHVAGNFPNQCESCHSTTSWRPAKFDHSLTRFPLTGAHQRADCARCHPGNRFAGTPTDCFACHEASYRSASNPSHAGFPTQCQACHTTNAWRPANFDHNRTRFPLTGAHQRTDCARCHVGGRYAGTPADCYACHQTSYRATTNPNHQAASFPTQCQACHTTNAWRPASFDHDGAWFPVYSGKHRGKWSACSDCHVNPSNYRAFECILCHEHNDRRKTDDQHRGVAGYVYQSAACYRCHPRGTKP